MSEIRRIRQQLKAAYRGDAWHGPALMENLEGVTAAVAAAHPLAGAHSIWELVRHVAAWEIAAAQSIERNQYMFLEGAADWPPVEETSEAAWAAALVELDDAQKMLVDALAKLTDDQLDGIVPGRDFTFYILLHGVVQHSLYHAGQIGLLKKL
jgi:hypothetical protein